MTELQNDYKFHNNLIKSDRHMTGGERNPCDLQFQYEKLKRIVRESRKMQIVWSGKKIKNDRTEIFQITASHLGLSECPAILNHIRLRNERSS